MFKIERTPAGERVAYARLFAGTLRPRQRVRVGGGEEAKPTSIKVFAPAGAPRHDTLTAGEMAAIRGLGAVRVGDAIGEPPPGQEETARFPRPALEAVVFALRPEEQGSLRAALGQLAEQDPLIDVRQDDHRHEIAVSLYGEVQKEVIGATLERDYGIAADFRETTVVCIERPAKAGEAEEVIHAKTHTNITGRSSPLSTNPFLATLALRIEPAPFGSGIEFRSDVEARYVPLYVFKSVDDFLVQMELYVAEAFDGGLGRLAGDRLPGHPDRVGLRLTGHVRRRFPAAHAARADHGARPGRDLGLRAASDLALEMPSSTSPGVLGVLGRLGGRVTGQFSANGVTKASAVLPVARVRTLQHQLPGLSMGEGILETRPGGYQPVGEHPPTRRRSSPSPLARDAWLASLAKRG